MCPTLINQKGKRATFLTLKLIRNLSHLCLFCCTIQILGNCWWFYIPLLFARATRRTLYTRLLSGWRGTGWTTEGLNVRQKDNWPFKTILSMTYFIFRGWGGMDGTQNTTQNSLLLINNVVDLINAKKFLEIYILKTFSWSIYFFTIFIKSLFWVRSLIKY